MLPNIQKMTIVYNRYLDSMHKSSVQIKLVFLLLCRLKSVNTKNQEMVNIQWPKIDLGSSRPITEQIVSSIVNNIQSGVYPPGMRMPSLNEMTKILGASKETIYKSYARLCKLGVIFSKRGKGYFVSDMSVDTSVLVILDKMSAHQQIAMDSFISTIGENASVTILTHYQNPDMFQRYIESEIGKYSYYVIFPHFKANRSVQYRIQTLLKRIQSSRLIIMDRLVPGLGNEYGAAYQSIEDDIVSGMQGSVEAFQKYSNLYHVGKSESLYPDVVRDNLKKFCKKNRLRIKLHAGIPETIKKGDLFFFCSNRLNKHFVHLAEKILTSGLKLGTDVGIICYNDYQINEIILGGLTTLSTDFAQMGRAAAEMILDKKMRRVHCNCSFIRRATF